MPYPESKKYTKADFLNYKKLAEKLGADPEEVYKVMRHHWKASTPVKYTVDGRNVVNQMIIMNTGRRSVGRTSRTSTTNKSALFLHPLGLAKFVESFNKGQTK